MVFPSGYYITCEGAMTSSCPIYRIGCNVWHKKKTSKNSSRTGLFGDYFHGFFRDPKEDLKIFREVILKVSTKVDGIKSFMMHRCNSTYNPYAIPCFTNFCFSFVLVTSMLTNAPKHPLGNFAQNPAGTRCL